MPALKLRVLYCDDYYGYTLESWLREVKWLLDEACGGVEISSAKLPENECRALGHPVYLEADGQIIIEGLPGEEGYLIEVLKSSSICGEERYITR